MFNSSSDLTSDKTDQTQKSLQNTKFANYMLSNYSNENILSSGFIDFESKNLSVITGNPIGPGIGGDVIDMDSNLKMNFVMERPFEKLSLSQRPYTTVPYLGRGSCDSDVELKLMIGQYFFDKKSENNIMEKSFSDYSLMHPLSNEQNENKIEAFDNNSNRGGESSRTM
jgi:hypothetical protein